MSVSTEVHRTLVKSPPELWSELSDPLSLARHLGELGEIRIVRTDPEKAVDWEATAADGALASGTVQIEPSGWGTKVTLSATRATPGPTEPEPAPEMAAERDPEPEMAVEHGPETEPISEPGPLAEAVPPSDPEPAATAETASQPQATAETAPEPQTPEPEPITEPEPERRLGFFARLFGRRKQRKTTEPPAEHEPPELTEEPPQEEMTVVSEPAPAPTGSTPEPPATADPTAELVLEEPTTTEPAPEEPTAEPVPEESTTTEPDIAAELAILEEQTAAVLTGVLDRLGAAHHRPFSRA